ncbi:hypothetical protein ACLM5H_22190 [Fredinandcohnia humi]
MKKACVLLIIVLVGLLVGCSNSFSIEKAEDFSQIADEFGENIDGFKDEFERLERKGKLTKEDQQNLVASIEDIKDEVDDFLSAEAPFGLTTVQKVIKKDVNDRVEILNELQEKAENNEATVRDIKRVNDDFFADVSLSLFNW